jgi:hypothetical protein
MLQLAVLRATTRACRSMNPGRFNHRRSHPFCSADATTPASAIRFGSSNTTSTAVTVWHD